VPPACLPPDAHVVFVGRIGSPWKERAECPKNMREARERGLTASVDIAEPYRAGLRGLEAGNAAVLLTWLHRGTRDLIVQKPRHAAAPRGTFALRSPVRPNPVGLHVVRLLAVDHARGTLEIDAIDVLDGTPLLDVKPWLASVDIPPEIPE
jgi:tRNA-Thr(GGU) m(6)t(6)A37 methyltransferase TsaA